jgi:hypothetical protein
MIQSKYIRELKWYEARDIAIAVVDAVSALHGLCDDGYDDNSRRYAALSRKEVTRAIVCPYCNLTITVGEFHVIATACAGCGRQPLSNEWIWLHGTSSNWLKFHDDKGWA